MGGWEFESETFEISTLTHVSADKHHVCVFVWTFLKLTMKIEKRIERAGGGTRCQSENQTILKYWLSCKM